MQIVGVAARPGRSSAPLGGAIRQTQRLQHRLDIDRPEVPAGNVGGGRARKGGLGAGKIDFRLVAARLSAFDPDRAHQYVPRGCGALQARQHAGKNVEIAHATDLPPRRVDRVESAVSGRSDDRREQPCDGGRALQRPARLVDTIRPVRSRPWVLIGRRSQGLRERQASVRDPGAVGGAHAAGEPRARARSRSANFCTLPVEVFGISAKTTKRGHL